MNSSHTSPAGCEADLLFGGRLQQPSPLAQAVLISTITINILAFPFTVVLNALVMIAVKGKTRLRAHKSNIWLALLALTAFAVGVVVQPVFIAVIIMFLLDEPGGYCVLRVLRHVMAMLSMASLFHLALISGERYIAIKHPFMYTYLVTEARLLVTSVLAWILSVILQVLFVVDKTILSRTYNALIGVSISFIIFCHVTVYCETRRHEQQLAAQQVTQEAREQFQKDKKALKLTSIILWLLLLCFTPMIIFIIVAFMYRSEITLQTKYMFFSFAFSTVFLNSLFNPIIYSVRMRQFRLAFIELLYRTVNIAEAEEIETRLFGAPNSVVRLEAEQEHQIQHHQNVDQQMS